MVEFLRPFYSNYCCKEAFYHHCNLLLSVLFLEGH